MFWATAVLLAALSGYLYGVGQVSTALLVFFAATGASYISAVVCRRDEAARMRNRLEGVILELHQKEADIENLRSRLLKAEEERTELREEVIKLREMLRETSREAELRYFLDKAIEAEEGRA